MIDELKRIQCTGCKVCGDVCPKNAIHFEIDKEGFWYPKIENTSCVECGLCVRVCPAVSKERLLGLQRENLPRVFEAVNKNYEVRIKSTSGGIYYALAEEVLTKGGYIAGCVYNDDWFGAHHIISNSKEGLNKIMGSKYFQSDTRLIYKRSEEILERGCLLLFCGAPCQVAGLYCYLKKEYKNLITADFICRGINSPKAYQAYMKELVRKYKSNIKEVHFKNKTQGWINLGTKVTFQNGKCYFRNRNTDPWVNGFIRGDLYMRPSCSECEYKSFPRIADISFGDFWGLSFSKEDAFNGVSLVMVNSVRGQKLLDSCNKVLRLKEHSLEEALKGNPAILQAIPMGKHRGEFFENIDHEPFGKLVWRLVGLSTPKWQVRYILVRCMAFLKNIRKKFSLAK